jgi:Zn-dependent M28 family amino/carboxypeptidase
VLGALPGAGALATQWIVVGAHYDHLGWQVLNGQVAVFNGADDNASGTAVVLEAARLLSRWIAAHETLTTSRRSMLFAAFGAEELGLLGSSAYAAGVGLPLDSVVAMVNLDMVGRLRDHTLTVQGTLTAPEWPALLAAANTDSLVLLYADDFLGASDQYPFIQRGIPAIHLFTGLHPDYHTPSDDVDGLNTTGLATIGRLALAIVWDLATRPVPPGRSAAGIGGLADRTPGR